jgi:hypothetical protein
LSIRNVSVIGADAGDFTIESSNCQGASIAPGANCVINVHFVPRSAKFCEATLVITHNGPGGRSEAPLSGIGAAPAISLSQTELQFGVVETGASGKPQPVTVINTGNAPLRISDLSLSGRGAFAVLKTNCANGAVNPNSICAIEIGFSPQKTGAFNQSLIIKSNAPGSPHLVKLIGTGARRERPKLGVNPNSVVFDDQIIGRGGKPRDVKLSNEGDGTLTINKISLDGDGARDFKIVRNCEGAKLMSNGNPCNVVILFTPLATGNRRADLVIDSNDEGSPHRAALSGNGIPRPGPVILHFFADRSDVEPRKGVPLCYGVANTDSASISPEIGQVKPVEKACVNAYPNQTTTYTLKALGADGQSVTKSAIVVKPPIRPDPRPEQSPAPKILFFTASPKVVAPGKSVRLCYGVVNASSAYINHGVGDVKPVESDCRAVALKETTTFTLTAKGANGRSDSQTVTAQVEYTIK